MKYILFFVAIVAIACVEEIDFNTLPNLKPLITPFPPIVNICKLNPSLCKRVNALLTPNKDVNLKGGWVDIVTTAIPIVWDVVKKIFNW